MKYYVKQSGLYIIYHLPAHLAGTLSAGVSGVIIGAIIEHHRKMATNIVHPILIITLPIIILFYMRNGVLNLSLLSFAPSHSSSFSTFLYASFPTGQH